MTLSAAGSPSARRDEAGAVLDQLFASGWLLLVNAINAGIVVAILWNRVPPPLLLGWFAAIAGLVAARLALARAFGRRRDALPPARWAALHMAGSGLTGLAWGATGAVFALTDDPLAHVLVVVTAAGMAAGALVLSFVHLPSFRAFALCHIVPVVLGLVVHGGATYAAIATMGVVFAVVLDRIACGLNRSTLRTLALQRQLIDSEQRMRDFAEAASHWLWETGEDGRYATVSNGFTRITGLPPASVLGRRPTEIRCDDDPERRSALIELERRMAARTPFMDMIVPLPLADGRRLTLAISGKPIFDAEGRFGGYRGITRDVTAQREAEIAAEEMRRARDVAAAADQLKTRFLASISHELRTPLNAVIGFSEMMAGEMLGPIGTPAYRGYVANIRDSGRHLLDLINDLLDMSRIELGHHRLVEAVLPLRDLVKPCIDMVRATVPDGDIAIVDDAVDPTLVVRVDQRAMRQVLINLLSNAARAAPSASTVSVAAFRHPAGDCVIVVTDRGPGIPATEIEAIFEPFNSSRPELARRRGGTGLGLWISRSLVEAHGGSLVLESDRGQGTRATVRLPAPRVLEAAAAPAPGADPAVAEGARRRGSTTGDPRPSAASTG